MPPTLHTSGFSMSAACFSNTSRNSNLVYSSSPVTTGIFILRRTSASASMFSASTGSSYQNGRYCSISSAMRTACIGASRRCISTSISTSGPTASRTALTFATAARSTSLLTYVRHGPGIGSNFSAVKPISITCDARSASAPGVGAPPDHPLAYTRILSLQAPPISLCTGAPYALPVMSHIACSSPLIAQW